MEEEQEVKKIPQWYKCLPNGDIEITTKDGVFELTDVEYDKVFRARQRAKGKEDIAMISESLVKPKLGELDILKLHTSSVMRLTKAIYDLYDIESFL